MHRVTKRSCHCKTVWGEILHNTREITSLDTEAGGSGAAAGPWRGTNNVGNQGVWSIFVFLSFTAVFQFDTAVFSFDTAVISTAVKRNCRVDMCKEKYSQLGKRRQEALVLQVHGDLEE